MNYYRHHIKKMETDSNQQQEKDLYIMDHDFIVLKLTTEFEKMYSMNTCNNAFVQYYNSNVDPFYNIQAFIDKFIQKHKQSHLLDATVIYQYCLDQLTKIVNGLFHKYLYHKNNQTKYILSVIDEFIEKYPEFAENYNQISDTDCLKNELYRNYLSNCN
jgi:hypothetical protein